MVNKRLLITVLMAVLIVPLAQAASLSGSIYGPDLELLPDSIVAVNSTPKQFIVSKEGNYEFQLSPGSYSIEAKYFEQELMEYYAEETIIIAEQGEFILDLILLPAEEFFLEDIPEFEDITLDVKKDNLTLYIALVVVIIMTFAVIFYIKRRSKKKEKKLLKETKKEIPDDLKQAIKILKENEGKMTQKELRKHIPLSEAKVSLIITDLEDRKIIRKIKKGRGNVIILK